MKNEVSERNMCYVMITHHIHNPFYSILFFFLTKKNYIVSYTWFLFIAFYTFIYFIELIWVLRCKKKLNAKPMKTNCVLFVQTSSVLRLYLNIVSIWAITKDLLIFISHVYGWKVVFITYLRAKANLNFCFPS